MNSIIINSLTKKYNKYLFKDYNNTIKKGVNLLIGPNGSGKSTMIKCIIGLIKYSGTIKVNGVIGYIPERFTLPDYIKVDTFLRNIALLSNSAYLPLVKRLKIEHKLNEYIKNLSKGMRQKLIIIQALIHNPDVIICDEPINGLDVKLQEEFICLLAELKKDNKTILISTHYPDIYKLIYDRIIEL